MAWIVFTIAAGALLVYGAIRYFRGDWSSAGVEEAVEVSAWDDDGDDEFDDADVGDIDDDDDDD